VQGCALKTEDSVTRRTAPILCTLVAVALLASPAFGAPAELDPSFSDDGRALTNFSPGFDFALAVAVQSDGKIVAVGRADDATRGSFALARYDVDGTLDPTFGTNGKTTTSFTRGDDFATGVVVQADGKIVAAGLAAGGDERFALARYNTDGTLDATFSGDGKLVTNFTSGRDFAWDVAFQADGKIVAAGLAAGGLRGSFALARYNPDGTLDTAFGGDGRVTTQLTALHDAATAVAVQSDGKVVVAGAAHDDTFFALARYNADGALDDAFDGDGMTMTDFTPRNDFAWDLAVQPDGKIATTGQAAGRFGVARFHADGTLDSTFGGDGRVTTDFTRGSDTPNGIVVQTDGKIVVVGDANNLRFAVARYNSDGALDTGFGGDGKVATNLTRRLDFAWDVSLQTDGKIVVAGGAGGRFGLVRYMGG
jgi:uncharacterized delta-60 repeat protein